MEMWLQFDCQKSYMFALGMSPAAARRHHESIIMTEDPLLMENSRVNPPSHWVYKLHEKWRRENFGNMEFDADILSPTVFLELEMDDMETAAETTVADETENNEASVQELNLEQPFNNGRPAVKINLHNSATLHLWNPVMKHLHGLLVASSTNITLLKEAEKFMKCCQNIKTDMELYSCLVKWNSSEQYGKKIKVHPTSMTRRKGNLKEGSVCRLSGAKKQNDSTGKEQKLGKKYSHGKKH